MLLELGDIEAVEREHGALQQLAEARRERYFTWLLAVVRAGHAHRGGQLERSCVLAWVARMLLLRNRHDDPDKALDLLTAARATAQELGLKALADKARPLRLAAEGAVRSPALPRPA